MKSALLALSLLVGCVDHLDPITGTQSLRVEIVTPADPGSQTNRLPDTQRTVTVNLTAMDASGQPDTGYTNDVQVYVQFLGTLSPYLGAAPLATIHVAGGKAMGQTITLPPVFGPTTIWFDDGTDMKPTYATGSSPTLWYRDPFIDDIQRPTDEMAVNALTDSPLETKNIAVDASRYGAMGRLVVTSVFAQGFTVSDMKCADANGTPPCVAGDYDHVEVFSFSAARDQAGNYIQEGQTISGFAGGISEFNGLTEIGFPQTFVDGAPDVNPAREPIPAKLDASATGWFTNKIMFERNEAAPIEIDGGVVCAMDADYTTYKQWKIDPNGTPGTPVDCSSNKNVINVITQGVVQIDPTTLAGKALPKVVGILRPVNIGTFNVWIIYPRGMSDLTLQ